MPRRANQFHELLSELRILIRMSQSRNDYGSDKLVDGFDLASSLYRIRRFLTAGELVEFDEGLQKLEQVIRRHKKQATDDGRRELFLLDLLKQLASSMDEAEKYEALQLLEKGFTSAEWISKHTLPEKVDILVIAALLEPELQCFIDQLSECREIASSDSSEMRGLIYYEGLLRFREESRSSSIRVVGSSQDQPGSTDCATLVSNAMRLFRPRVLVLTGVCEGLSNAGVQKNDLVVPSAAFTYDAGKYTDNGFEQESRWCDVDPRIIRKIRSQGQKILSSIAQHIKSVGPSCLRIPQIHTDVMACGAAVAHDGRMIGKVAGSSCRVVGIDMESYSFLRAAHLTNERVGALVVKGVVDFSQHQKGYAREHASFWAAAFIVRFLAAELETLCPREGA